ncbi:hypothetical protein PAXINDRAFT_97574 [Paxillus involutus ATCC 200175]|nr:hypothetical protein PAXINDRAFT_97574 [Paxillus involutus ATCC 200175]
MAFRAFLGPGLHSEFAHQPTPDHHCVDGFIEIATIWTGVTSASRIPNSRAYVGALYFVPSLVSVLMIEFLPWKNQIRLLFGIWLVDIGRIIVFLVDKRYGWSYEVTTDAIMLGAYCIGNAAGPFM